MIKYMFVVLCLMMGFTAKAAVLGNSGVQVMEYVYDFSVQGGSLGFKDLTTKLNNALPAGASILRVSYYVQTAMASGNGSGSATLAVGDSGSGGRYKAAAAYDNAVWADENLVSLSAAAIPNQVDAANEGLIGVTIGVSPLTAGKISFLIEYVQVKR